MVGTSTFHAASLSDVDGGMKQSVEPRSHEGIMNFALEILQEHGPPILHGSRRFALLADFERDGALEGEWLTEQESRLDMQRVVKTSKLLRRNKR